MFIVFLRFGTNRSEELNNYSGLMTRRKNGHPKGAPAHQATWQPSSGTGLRHRANPE
jgi:hypothetical protein